MHTREASTLDLFTDSIRIMGDGTICGVIEFSIRLDPVRLAAAAQACYAAHPILHSRLVRGQGPAHWVMINPVPEHKITAEECSEEYHSLVPGPVDPYGPDQMRLRLLRRPSGDVIVINLSHAAADAFGLKTLMSQILEEYCKPGSVPPAIGGIPERDTLWTRDLLDADMPQSPEIPVIDPMWPDPFGTSDDPASFHRSSIGPDHLEALRLRAKEFGGNLNDLLLSAYFLAMSDLTAFNGPFPLYFPVNLRQHLHEGFRAMSNQAVNVGISIERVPYEGMAEILPRIIRETQKLKLNGIGIAEQAAMDAGSDPEGRNVHRMVERMAALQKTGLADIFISNPGPFHLPDMDGLTGAYLCYPGCYMPTTCLITSTFRGTMTITIAYQNSERAREGTSRALELFLHHLHSDI